MPTEPTKAEPPKRKRRWFQFSLSELLLAVTLCAAACWVFVDRRRIIHERDDLIHARDDAVQKLKALSRQVGEYKAQAKGAEDEAGELAQQAAAESSQYKEQIKLLKAVIRDSK